MTQNFIENIFIEIEIQCLNTTKDIIIGLIYRVPDYNTFFFQSGTIIIVMQITLFLLLLSQLEIKQEH